MFLQVKGKCKIGTYKLQTMVYMLIMYIMQNNITFEVKTLIYM